MMKRYFYQTYGLNVASEIELPELLVADSTQEIAVTISLAALTETLAGMTVDGSYIQTHGDKCQINVRDIARYRIEQGQRIFVDPIPGTAPGDIRLFLLGSAFGALLHQRGWLPLHVSAVATPHGVWAFTGESGAGKSTLAAALHYHFGWPLLSDDVGIIKSCNSSRPVFHPGPPRLKLWQDALTHFAIDSHNLIPDQVRIDKFHLRLEHGFEQEPQCLHALVVLERTEADEPSSLIQVSGLASFQAVASAIYRPEVGQRVGNQTLLFRQCAALANQVAVYRYRRPWSLAVFDSSLQPLLRQVLFTLGHD